MRITTSKVIVLLAPLSLFFSFEFSAEVLNGLFVVLEPIVAISDMKDRIPVKLHTFHSFLQTFPKLQLLFFEDLQSWEEFSFVV